MVSNVRDRNIDSSRREDSRKGQVDRCEVINVRPHVAPYPDDKDFNTVDVQLIDRPRINGKPLHIKYVKLNSLQRYHGRFQGEPWNARIGDMIYVYWLAEREALVLGLCTSVEQEPVCRSQADAHHQEYVFKLSPWEEPKTNDDKNYIEFPDPKHPECYKWWPKTRDSLWIFDCLEGHNTPSCCGQACNSLDDHQSSTCFKNFSDISPTTIDLPRRFKFLHHCGSFWYYDEDGTIHIAGKVSGSLKNQQIFYPSGKILLENVVDSCSAILDDDGDIKLNPADKVVVSGDMVITGTCTHNACSCEGEFVALGGVAGGQTLCGDTEEDGELVLCGTSDESKGCVTVDADLECNGDLGNQIKSSIKSYCDPFYAAKSGWAAAPELTYASADTPTFTVTCKGDYTGIIPVGARISLTHSGTTKYFIVTKTAYASPSTTLTLYGGTDYTLSDSTITDAYYSPVKAPIGFPLDPDKWTVLLSDSTDRHQSSPVKNTIYNPGSLSISLPIGIWNVSFQVILVCAASSGAFTDVYGGLSSSLSSFDNQALRGRGYLGGPTGGIFIGLLYRSTVLNIATKTTYYVICMTDLDNQSLIGFNGASDASTEVRAVCAYL